MESSEEDDCWVFVGRDESTGIEVGRGSSRIGEGIHEVCE